MGKTDGDNYTLDDMFVSSAAQRESEGREEERMRNRAIGESRRLAASMDKCHHCFSSQELQKHLIVAIGSKVRDLVNVRVGGSYLPVSQYPSKVLSPSIINWLFKLLPVEEIFLSVILCPGVPEPPSGIINDRRPLSHLSSPASLLCHRIGRGCLVRNAG